MGGATGGSTPGAPGWLTSERVRRLVDWAVVATVAAYPLLSPDARAPAGRAYGLTLLVGAGLLAALDVPAICLRLRARFGVTAVRSGRALLVWTVVATAVVLSPTSVLAFLLVVPVASAAVTLSPGPAALLSVATLVVVLLAPGAAAADVLAVWVTAVAGVALLTATTLRQKRGDEGEHARSRRQATRRAELLNVVATTSLTTHALPTDEVVTAVVNGALGLGVSACVLFEPDSPAGVYRCRDATGVPIQVVDERCPLTADDAVTYVLRTGRPIAVTGSDGEPALPAPVVTAGFGSLWAVPVFVDDEVEAVLCVLDHGRRAPAEDEFVALRIMADRIADALAHARRLEIQSLMLVRLRDAERVKDDFVSTISHELRTPATVIKAANELLSARWHQLDEPTRRTLGERIDRHADDLASLLDTLLAYRDLSAGRLQPDPAPVRVRALVDLLRAQLQARDEMRDHGIEWDVDDVVVHVDASQIRRVLAILVDNALTHTPPGTHVVVTVRRDLGNVSITVRDDGPGIGADVIDSIRMPFVRQGDVLTRASRGVGLGLAIAELIVRAHGGDLTLQSRPGAGTTCHFELPVTTDDSTIVLPEVDRQRGPRG